MRSLRATNPKPRHDRECGVGEIGGGATIADVVEAIGCVVVAGIGRVAFGSSGAVNELDAIEAMKVSCGDEDKSRVTTVCDEKLVLLRSEGERVGRLEAADALEMLAGV
jgi:hypothetical protein